MVTEILKKDRLQELFKQYETENPYAEWVSSYSCYGALVPLTALQATGIT